jgi:hypothetical protein
MHGYNMENQMHHCKCHLYIGCLHGTMDTNGVKKDGVTNTQLTYHFAHMFFMYEMLWSTDVKSTALLEPMGYHCRVFNVTCC